MRSYYCPYCSIDYRIKKEQVEGDPICTSCGDPLIKKRYIKTTQIVALIITLSFVVPFILIVITYLNEVIKYNQKEQFTNFPTKVSYLS